MTKGTRLILLLSAVIGLGVALVPPIVSYNSCKSDLHAYEEDQQDWSPVVNHSKPLNQASDRALQRAYRDGDFRDGRWKPPICRASDDLLVFVLIGSLGFVALFVGGHLAWLATRAFNKLMDKLK